MKILVLILNVVMFVIQVVENNFPLQPVVWVSASDLQSLCVRPVGSGQCHQHLSFILTLNKPWTKRIQQARPYCSQFFKALTSQVRAWTFACVPIYLVVDALAFAPSRWRCEKGNCWVSITQVNLCRSGWRQVCGDNSSPCVCWEQGSLLGMGEGTDLRVQCSGKIHQFLST